jgi:UDPglucose 6-dehydrogenase
MNIAIVGTGYVGLVTGACLADFGHTVTCADKDAGRIGGLRRGEMPFYEPGLTELVQRHSASGRLRFTTSLAETIQNARAVFLAVGTPEDAKSGEADLSQVLAVVTELLNLPEPCRVIVTKSTVPVGTGARIQAILRDRFGALASQFDVVSNPEFLREGSAVSDFLRPDRVIIGAVSERATALMRDIYRPLYLIETPLMFTSLETAEMIKYASNAFLAVKISFINEVANLCDKTGADVHVVAKAMGQDKRIGPKFLHPGPGYGGSCFPKDTRALMAVAAHHGVTLEVVSAAIRANDSQRRLVVERIRLALNGLSGRQIAYFGLAFKPNTSDVRESPALWIARELARAGACIRAYDPVAMREATHAMQDVADRVVFAEDCYLAAQDADALVIATEWNEFRGLELERLKTLLRQPIIFDLRNVLEPERVFALGFDYYGTGRAATGRLASLAHSAERPFVVVSRIADQVPDAAASS